MIHVRGSADRGHASHGWLDSQHTFSFADYHDPDYMGFRSLRVINEDRVQPSKGFGTHSHRDMEILSYVISGALEHRDSMGSGSVIRPGEIQLMRAGTGVTHSEFNHSDSEIVHFLQIWVVPDAEGLEPAYAQYAYADTMEKNVPKLIASPDGAGGSVAVAQDIRLFTATLDEGAKASRDVESGRSAWLQVVRGKISVNSTATLSAGDGAAVSEEQVVLASALEPSEFLFFDLG